MAAKFLPPQEDTNDLNLYYKFGEQITDYKIKQLIKVLNDVIIELS